VGFLSVAAAPEAGHGVAERKAKPKKSCVGMLKA
jgi:hypothetical protein